jgi:hypothetical protein
MVWMACMNGTGSRGKQDSNGCWRVAFTIKTDGWEINEEMLDSKAMGSFEIPLSTTAF